MNRDPRSGSLAQTTPLQLPCQVNNLLNNIYIFCSGTIFPGNRPAPTVPDARHPARPCFQVLPDFLYQNSGLRRTNRIFYRCIKFEAPGCHLLFTEPEHSSRPADGSTPDRPMAGILATAGPRIQEECRADGRSEWGRGLARGPR